MTSAESSGPESTAGDSVERRIADGPRGGAKTWYDVLEVSLDVSQADLQKAYERALALVDGRSIGGYLMLDPMAAESARADVEAAFAVLGDPERRRAYVERLTGSGAALPAPAAAPEPPAEQGSPVRATEPIAGWSAEGIPVVDEAGVELPPVPDLPEGDAQVEDRRASQLKFLAPDGKAEAPPRTETPRPGALDIRFEAPSTDSGAAAAMRGPLPIAPAPALAPSAPPSTPPSTAPAPQSPLVPAESIATELPDHITGAVMRALREARGLSLDDVALQTKVRRTVLQAIEEQDLPNLPARVYLRGFVTQVGRVLKVDRARLAEGYLKTIEQAQRG